MAIITYRHLLHEYSVHSWDLIPHSNAAILFNNSIKRVCPSFIIIITANKFCITMQTIKLVNTVRFVGWTNLLPLFNQTLNEMTNSSSKRKKRKQAAHISRRAMIGSDEYSRMQFLIDKTAQGFQNYHCYLVSDAVVCVPFVCLRVFVLCFVFLSVAKHVSISTIY